MQIVSQRELQPCCGRKLHKIISEAPDNYIISVEKGTYFFNFADTFQKKYPLSNTHFLENRTVNLPIDRKKNLVIDFNGSLLQFNGWTMPIAMDNCQNITLKNFTVDWIIPTGAEADVVQADDQKMTLSIDEGKYPYRVEDGKLIFADGIFENECWSMFEFDGQSLLARGETLDHFGNVVFQQADSYVIAYGDFSVPAKPGNILLLRHGIRNLAGIYCQNSENIHFENITMHASCGIGFVCQFCKDLHFRDIFTVPNTAAGRRVTSVHDDGIQCSNCRGTVEITGCCFRGLMDDGINIHGTTTVAERIDGNTVFGEFKEGCSAGFPFYAIPGDRISFLARDTMDTLYEETVASCDLTDRMHFTLQFQKPLPDFLVGSVMENVTNAPMVVCRKNSFQSGRARGMLISTPWSVLIENNVFETSGSAILSSGDANYWFESGACKNMVVRNNVFTEHCLSGNYQFCRGVISLCPVIHAPEKSRGFHENITIENNTFVTPGRTVLYALCTKNLIFTHNTIKSKATGSWKPVHLEYCSSVCCEPNILEESQEDTYEDLL